MPEIENIMKAVTKVTGICKRKIMSRSRMWPIVEARMIYVLCASRTIADVYIAASLGRNRTTVVKTRKNALSYMSVCKTFRDKYAKALESYGIHQ